MKIKLLEPIDGYEEIAEYRFALSGETCCNNQGIVFKYDPIEPIQNCCIILTPKPKQKQPEYYSGQELFEAGAEFYKNINDEIIPLLHKTTFIFNCDEDKIESYFGNYCSWTADRKTWHSFIKE